jgi:integrase
MKTNFTDPKLCHYDYDIKKDWFVYFRFKNQETGNPKLFVYKAGINLVKSKRARIAEANSLREVLHSRLYEENWNPFTSDTNVTIQQKVLIDVLNEIMSTKRTVMKPKSVRTYDDILKMFIKWLKKCDYDHLYPANFSPVMARAYLDYLLSEHNYKGKSHNGQLGIIKYFFNAMIDREIIAKNPFKGIKELPEDVGKNHAFSYEEKMKLKEILLKHDKQLYYFVQFVYYCFIRRSELIQLKVGDIDFSNKTITVQSAVSKNRKQQSVIIPVSFEPVIYEMGLDKQPKDSYIFSHNLMPGVNKLARADYITFKLRKFMNLLKIGKEKNLYSWKATGVSELYNATKDPYLVMGQCRHSDISITMIYLKSLGLQMNEKLRLANFTF